MESSTNNNCVNRMICETT